MKKKKITIGFFRVVIQLLRVAKSYDTTNSTFPYIQISQLLRQKRLGIDYIRKSMPRARNEI
jgi:hypothetical protein